MSALKNDDTKELIENAGMELFTKFYNAKPNEALPTIRYYKYRNIVPVRKTMEIKNMISLTGTLYICIHC